jgi:uncharacterized protein YdaU (DUF1376 family)
MHYYRWHVADYAASTAHLSNEEDLAYRRLLDFYYGTEEPIPLDLAPVARKIRCGLAVLEQVLKDFFVLREDGWHQPRADDEIAEYQNRSRRATENGRKGGRPRKKPIETQEVSKPKLTTNHKPITIRPENISTEVWDEWIQMRKLKRAPVSSLVLRGLDGEAKKAGLTLEQVLRTCVERGWAGFKAEWVAGKQQTPMADTDYGQGGAL